MISLTMLTVQIALSFALILAMRSQHWPIDYQAAGPAVALMVSVTITSLIKALVLKRVLKAPVSGYRWPLVWAALAAILVGTIFTSLPKRSEEHTSELQSLMRISYAVFCLKKKKNNL